MMTEVSLIETVNYGDGTKYKIQSMGEVMTTEHKFGF